MIQRQAAGELPGGSFEPTLDATILQAVGRELWEETGLRLRRARRLVNEVEFQDNHYTECLWRNATFVVDLDDTAIGTGRAATDHIRDKSNPRNVEPSILVRIDPQEHQDWGWATEAEVIN